MHVQEVFPYKAILSLPESTYDSALNDLHCTTVTLKKAMNETSVIATRCVGGWVGVGMGVDVWVGGWVCVKRGVGWVD